MEFELIDGNKFFKVAWHNTLHGMKFMVLIKAVSLRLKKKQKLNSKACLKEPPPFCVIRCPSCERAEGETCSWQSTPLFWGRGTLAWEACREAHLPPPASRPLLQLCDSWRGWNLPSRWCQALAQKQHRWKRNGTRWPCSLSWLWAPSQV